MYNKAIEWELFTGNNPAAFIKPYKEQSRDRFIQPDELPRLFDAINNEPNRDIRDYVYLSLYTGARKSNILSMRWQDINLDYELWRIEETKNGIPQNIPLIADAISLLKERKSMQLVSSPFVFPSHGKKGHMVEPKTGWKRILDRAEIQNLRLHDLRRTMGSYQAINGTSLNIIGQSLGHKSLTATQIYSRLTNDPVKQSMTQAVEKMKKHTLGN